MTRDEIYDHLAQVYLGKKKETEKKKEKFSAWIVINILIAVIIFASAFYGFTAFLVHRSDILESRIIFALTNGPVRMIYDLRYPHPPVKSFSLSVPTVDAQKYSTLQFSIRGMEAGYPGIVRVEVRNYKNEVASILLENVKADWREVEIPLSQFEQITDWSNLSSVSFFVESWNAERQHGGILIDHICFST